MALITIRVGNLVVSIHVTIRTRGRDVLTREWKRRRCVIERGGLPDGRAVTLRAIVIELPGDMIGSFYLREIALMAAVTFEWKCFSILSVDMASLAWGNRVFSV